MRLPTTVSRLRCFDRGSQCFPKLPHFLTSSPLFHSISSLFSCKLLRFSRTFGPFAFHNCFDPLSWIFRLCLQFFGSLHLFLLRTIFNSFSIHLLFRGSFMDLIYGSDFYLIVDSLDLLESFRFLRTFGSFAFHKALILFHGSLDFACNILDLCIFLLRILQRIFNSFWIHLLFRGSFRFICLISV